MCIWKVAEEDRHCEFCTYIGGCDGRDRGKDFDEIAREALDTMAEVVPYDLMHPCRKSNIAWARFMVEYYLRSLGYSLSKIGSLFKRNHSNVVHSVGAVESMLKSPKMYPSETKIWNEFQEKLTLQHKK